MIGQDIEIRAGDRLAHQDGTTTRVLAEIEAGRWLLAAEDPVFTWKASEHEIRMTHSPIASEGPRIAKIRALAEADIPDDPGDFAGGWDLALARVLAILDEPGA